MFSLLHFHHRENAGRLLWRPLCPLLALAFICTAPGAFGQESSSKDSKPKVASEAKSQTKSSAKSKTSSGTKSQAGTKSKRGGSARTGSQSTAKTKSSTGSETTEKGKSGEPPQTEGSKTDKAEVKTTDQPKADRPDQPQADSSPSSSPGLVDVSSIKPDDVRGFYNNSPEVQELLTAALELTEQNLGYVYGSADPARGGMDCSGTIYFLLQKMGITDVPRSASQQYVWVRRFGAFKPVVSTSVESFELDDLRPGNLLFWTGTYAVDVDPPVTHTMIYLGKARSDGRRLMVGASDGRTFRGAKKYGVSVFDFVIPNQNSKNPMSRFIGYSEIPR